MTAPSVPGSTTEDRFNEVLALIQSAKQQAMQAVNTQLIELYWQVGAYISRKLEKAEWGDSVVSQLAEHLAQTRGCVGLPAPICFACVNSTKLIAATRKSHRW